MECPSTPNAATLLGLRLQKALKASAQAMLA